MVSRSAGHPLKLVTALIVLSSFNMGSGPALTKIGATDVPSVRSRTLEALDIDISMAICPGLTAISNDDAPSDIDCESYCAEQTDCDTWQYCPSQYGSCRLVGMADEVVTIKANKARCYISSASSAATRCVPDFQERWVGYTSRKSLVPEKNDPVLYRRGFTGFVRDKTIMTYDCADSQALSMQDSWYTAWQIREATGNDCQKQYLWGVGANDGYGPQMGAEFVPTINAIGAASTVLADIEKFKTKWARLNVHMLLGYDNPDTNDIDPGMAAKDWVKVQNIAKAFDPPLELASPAPSSGDFDASGRSAWLDSFLEQCEDLDGCDPTMIKYINLHDNGDSVDALSDKIRGIYDIYGERKVFLSKASITGVGKCVSRLCQDAYMEELLPMLEAHPYVYRYAWHESRMVQDNKYHGEKDLLVYNIQEPTITSTGIIYSTWPRNTGDMDTTPPPPPPTPRPPTPAPPTPVNTCSAGCEVENYPNKWCWSQTGCEGCPFEETCEKLCIRCAGKATNYGGLDCDCATEPPEEDECQPAGDVDGDFLTSCYRNDAVEATFAFEEAFCDDQIAIYKCADLFPGVRAYPLTWLPACSNWNEECDPGADTTTTENLNPCDPLADPTVVFDPIPSLNPILFISPDDGLPECECLKVVYQHGGWSSASAPPFDVLMEADDFEIPGEGCR